MLCTPIGSGLWLYGRRWAINRATSVQIRTALDVLRVEGQLLLLLRYEAVAFVGDG